MQDKENKKKYWNKLFHKYRFVIMTESSFEEKISVTLSRLNVLAFLGFFVFTCFFVTLILISYSPLSEYVPGKSNKEVQKELIILSLKSDSLQKALDNRDFYLNNINNIITGKTLSVFERDTIAKPLEEELDFSTSKEDSLLRIDVETQDKSSIYFKEIADREYLVFFPPVYSGLISDKFDVKSNHFGVDIVAKEQSRIRSVLEGTVVISHWTAETGFVIGIQHAKNYFSLYKHNSVLLKNVGDFVSAGENIAIIGNSGEFSSGPHLHFELWYKGNAVDPEYYITF